MGLGAPVGCDSNHEGQALSQMLTATRQHFVAGAAHATLSAFSAACWVASCGGGLGSNAHLANPGWTARRTLGHSE